MIHTPGEVRTLADTLYTCARKTRIKKQGLPILNHAALIVDDGRILFVTSTLEYIDDEWIPVPKYHVGRCTPSAKWAACVPSTPFRDYMKVTGKDQVTLELDQRVMTLTVRTENSKAVFKCLDIEEFPLHGKYPA